MGDPATAQVWKPRRADLVHPRCGYPRPRGKSDSCPKTTLIRSQARDIFPPQQNQVKSKLKAPETGSLPTMTALFTSLLTLLQPLIPSLLTNPHASPPLRLLLLVCTPGRSIPPLAGQQGKKQTSLIRSKKSGKYRKGHGVQGKSIFSDDQIDNNGKETQFRVVPTDLAELRKRVTAELLGAVSPVEWRSMGLNEVGSAAVQLLVGLEVEDGASLSEGSLLDHLMEGLVSELGECIRCF